jgi:hypothetical protein
MSEHSGETPHQVSDGSPREITDPEMVREAINDLRAFAR